MRVYCLGDSLTAGYGVRPEQCWRVLAAARTGCELMNGGVNGDTSWGMIYRLRRDAIPARPDALFLLGGSNDIIRDGSDHMLRRNMAELLAMAAGAGIPPIIGIPCPFLPHMARELWSPETDFYVANQILAGYADWLREQAAALRAPVVDFWSLLDGMEESERRALYLDGLHLLPEGHWLMALTFSRTLEKYIKEERS